MTDQQTNPETTTETPVADKAAPAPAAAATVPSGLTQAEIDSLRERAANFDTIVADPEISVKVLDHFKAKTGRVGKQVTTETKAPETKSVDDIAYKQLLNRQATLEIDLFRMRHPDMDSVKDNMAKLMTKYGMDLEDAYNFSKSGQVQNSQKSADGGTATPTAETNKSAGIGSSGETNFSEVEKQISDPKATPHLDDAIELAWKAAKKMHAS